MSERERIAYFGLSLLAAVGNQSMVCVRACSCVCVGGGKREREGIALHTHAYIHTYIHTQMETACGTPEYLAPELVAMVAKGDNTETAYSSKVDVWAVGVILYVMISGFHPFYTGNQAQLYDAIMKGNYGFPSPAVCV